MDGTPPNTVPRDGATREGTLWADAFHRNVLGRQEAAAAAAVTTTTVFADPQPSRRPTPHNSTTKTMTTTSAGTATALSSSSASGSQPRSTHTSPHPPSHGGGHDTTTHATPAAARIATRTVAAVAVHPPLSRNLQRTSSLPAPAAAGVSAAPPALPSSHAQRAALSVTSTPIRSAPHNAGGASAGPAPPLPPSSSSNIYTTPHARLHGGSSSSAKAKPLSQLQLQTQRSGSGANTSNSPLASAATPHIAPAYAGSPFFQRVAEVAAPPAAATAGAAAAVPNVPATAGTANTTNSVERGEQEDCSLLQEVTPITRGGGDSWRHDSQLLSQSRGDAGSATATSGVEYLSGCANPTTAATLPTGGVSQLLLPPPPPMPSAAPAAASQPSSMHAFGYGSAASLPWDATNNRGGVQSSPYPQAPYYPPGYTPVNGNGSQRKPFNATPPFTPGNGTHLSASPGGLTGSRNTTLQMAHHPQSSLQPSCGMEVAAGNGPAAAAGAAAMYAKSSYLYEHPSMREAAVVGDSSSYFPQQQHQQQHLGGIAFQSPTSTPMLRSGNMRVDSVQYTNGSSPINTTTTPSTAIATGLSGVALEKQLLHASKEELVQILLELGSCNTDASRFIDAKAFFFAFRHEHARLPTPAPITAAAMATNPTNSAAALGAIQNCKSFGADVVPASEKAQQQRQGGSGVEAAPFSTGGSTTSSNSRGIARCIFPAEAADDEDETEDAALTVARPTLTAAAPPSALPPQRRLRPEERDFSMDVHPCLRWYGACRNATSCVYASLPRNLCLNWVRGACMAHAECGGVHRLPQPCPPEIQRIYLLHHGVARCGAGETLRALSAHHSLAPAAAQQKTQPQHRYLGREEAVTNVPATSPHTPEEQSIHKDAIVGGDSTPHRHPADRPTVWSSADVFVDDDDVADEAFGFDAAAHAYLRDVHVGSAASPLGSSCSTLEDCATADPVNRCLCADFDSAASPTEPLSTVASGGGQQEGNATLAACAGRRSPVLELPASPLVCEVKEPLRVAPLRSVATAVQRLHGAEEVPHQQEDCDDFSAPAAGTRTRVQSPACT